MIQPQLVDRDIVGREGMLRRALIGAITLLLLGTVLVAFGKGTFDNRIEVSALVADAGGSLTAGSDVKSSGVIIGRVTGLEQAGDKVRITMEIDGNQAQQLSSEVTASILPATVFGTTFVDLTGADGPGRLAHGAQIPQTTDAEVLELQDALDSTDRVLGAIDPAELASTLAAVSTALDGRGREIGETIVKADAYLARLEPHLPLLREDLELAARYLAVLRQAAPDLFDAVRDSSPLLKTLRDKGEDIDAILTGATDLSRTTDAFLRENRRLIETAIAQTAQMFAALYDYREGFPVGFRAFSRFASTASEGLRDGPWLQTDVFLKTGGDEPYSAEDCPRYGSARGDNCPGAP